MTKQSKIYLARVKWRATNITLKTKPTKSGIGEWVTTQADIDNDYHDLKRRIMLEKANVKHLIEVLDLEVISEHGMTNLPQKEPIFEPIPNVPLITLKDVEWTKGGFKLHEYQEQMVESGLKIIKQHHMVIYALEMRLGKSHIALETATRLRSKSVLFLTPKKAIKSVEEDMTTGGHKFNLTVTNYEQLHKIEDKFDLIICDEFHKIGSKYPKPSVKSTLLKKLCADGVPIVFLSGTPTPESYSQIYNSLGISPFSPFKEYASFYRWFEDYGNMYKRKINGNEIRFYDRAKADEIFEKIEHLYLSYTQKEAEFNHEVLDEIHNVPMKASTMNLYDYLAENQVYECKGGGAILGDTPAKLMSKLHQISSGSFIKEMDDATTEAVFIDDSKLNYIHDNFKTYKKLAIFYCFDAEGKALRDRFTPSTSNPEEFERWDGGYFIGQVRSVREGVKISSADTLIFYNLGFSSTDYIQARQRHQARERDVQPIAHFLFSTTGIEAKVYKAVTNKKNFTARYYK